MNIRVIDKIDSMTRTPMYSQIKSRLSLLISLLMLFSTVQLFSSQKKQKKAHPDNQTSRISQEFGGAVADYFGLFPNIKNIETVEIVSSTQSEIIYKVISAGDLKEFTLSGKDLSAFRYYINNRESFDTRLAHHKFSNSFKNLRVKGILIPKAIQTKSRYRLEIKSIDNEKITGYLFIANENYILLSNGEIYDWRKNNNTLLPANNIKSIKVLPKGDEIIINGNELLFENLYRKLRIMDCLYENDFSTTKIHPPEIKPEDFNLVWDQGDRQSGFDDVLSEQLSKIEHSISLIYPLGQLLEESSKYGLSYHYMVSSNRSLFAEYNYIDVESKDHTLFSIKYIQAGHTEVDTSGNVKDISVQRKVVPDYEGSGFSVQIGQNFHFGTEALSNILPIDDLELFLGASAIYQKTNFNTKFIINPDISVQGDEEELNFAGAITNLGLKFSSGIYYKLFKKVYLGTNLDLFIFSSNKIILDELYTARKSTLTRFTILEQDYFYYRFGMGISLRIFL